jgi:hypothetical protein
LVVGACEAAHKANKTVAACAVALNDDRREVMPSCMTELSVLEFFAISSAFGSDAGETCRGGAKSRGAAGIGDSDIKKEVPTDSEVRGQAHVWPNEVEAVVRDSAFTEQVAGDVLSLDAKGASCRDESGLDDVVSPGPSPEAIAPLATPIMETPGVDMGAARTEKRTVSEFSKRHAETELEGAAKMHRECGEPATCRESRKPEASERPSARAETSRV